MQLIIVGLKLIREFQPDAIVHLAEQPSAPYSMRGQKEATFTQQNNIIGTLNVIHAIKEINPKIHLIKLGTAGEYPDWLYPDMVIPEGSRIKVNYGEYKNWEIPTPRYAGSWYHFSKLHDSNNIDYACRIWGIRATDLNQAPVYGHLYDTRFDIDECFGTVVNRFVAQAVSGHPLTVYGKGGQTRGYIHIKNSMQAIELMIKNPAKQGEFRVVHQTTEEKTINQIAELVNNVRACEIEHIENPRAEQGENKFKFEAKLLKELGLKPIPMHKEIPNMLDTVSKYRDRIDTKLFLPKTKWI